MARQRAGVDPGDAAVVRSVSLPCRDCGGYVQKNGGCNHMTCTCGAEFCWECGLEIDGVVYEHYMRGDRGDAANTVCNHYGG